MITYNDLVNYTKENHISWSTDLFDVLRGFFNERKEAQKPKSQPVFQPDMFSEKVDLPSGTEYTVDDVLNLFSL